MTFQFGLYQHLTIINHQFYFFEQMEERSSYSQSIMAWARDTIWMRWVYGATISFSSSLFSWNRYFSSFLLSPTNRLLESYTIALRRSFAFQAQRPAGMGEVFSGRRRGLCYSFNVDQRTPSLRVFIIIQMYYSQSSQFSLPKTKDKVTLTRLISFTINK